MAHFLSTEQHNFYNKNIESYSKNRVGEYSKYLNMKPIMVTYYSINNVASRTDVGTGNISSVLGSNSPIRFNKISGLPIYNIPDLKPIIEYSPEEGVDANLELNDLTILPNTIIPREYDMMVIEIPNTPKLLFKVLEFQKTNLQSNDFYTFGCELYAMDDNTKFAELEKQVSEKYKCVFENIGTEDKCLIKEEDIEKIYQLENVYMKLREIYQGTYFDKPLNSFVLIKDFAIDSSPIYLYDIYLTRFIKESKIFEDDFDNNLINLVYEDTTPNQFDMLWRSTLWNAVLNQDILFLKNTLYNTPKGIQKVNSIFKFLSSHHDALSLIFINDRMEIPPSMTSAISEYFPRDFVNYIKGIIELVPEIIETPLPIVIDETVYPTEEIDPNIVDDTQTELPTYITPGTLTIEEVVPEVEPDAPSYICSEVESIIYKYLRRESTNVENFSNILLSLTDYNKTNFYYIPIIIYILGNIHKSYFNKNEN